MKRTPFVCSVLLSLMFAVTTGAQQSVEPLTLQRVVDEYLAKNVELQAAKLRLERTRADQIAAKLRPNPGLTLTAENMKVNGPESFGSLYELAASYAETVELGGKRRLRESVAERTVSVAEAQFADTIRRGIADLKRTYLDSLLARYNVQIATENRQTFEQLLQFNLARFEQGAIPEADLIKVRLERMRFDGALTQAQLAFRQATIRLQERIGQTTFPQQNVIGELDLVPMNSEIATLRQTALHERPDVLAAEREVEAAETRLSLEQARGRADITPFVGYKRLGHDNTVMFGVSMPLKIRDRNEGGIARAEADQKIAQSQLQTVRNRVLAEVQAAYERFQSTTRQVQVFRSDLLNRANESRSIALAAYQEGGTPLTPVLEAQRTQTGVRQEYFRTLFDSQSSLIDLELAVGKDLQP